MNLNHARLPIPPVPHRSRFTIVAYVCQFVKCFGKYIFLFWAASNQGNFELKKGEARASNKITSLIKEERSGTRGKKDYEHVDRKANQELIVLLAKKFKVPKSAIAIKSGFYSRNKLVEVPLQPPTYP